MRSSLLVSVAAALGLSVPGCTAAPPTAPGVAHLLLAQGLEQTVQLTPAEPARGDQLSIVSVVTNRTADSAALTSRICGLDTAGDLGLVTARLACAGYSVSATLASGASITGADVRVVASPPGRYTLRVRQLLVPEAWVEVPVVVR
ncbi:MAG TPA: hypothetical protein VEU55_10840 [Gemmatimonadales bacterium]|nr:hypothetical protein [Gemmatimonadales bacterium]